MKSSQQSAFHGIALLAIIVVLCSIPSILPNGIPKPETWLAVLALLTGFTLIAGHWVTGIWRGAFVNDRNRMSLSQSQLVLWTLIVLSAYLTGACVNLALSVDKPLDIAIPQSLWILMGISTTSLIGSPLLASRKKSQRVDAEEEQER